MCFGCLICCSEKKIVSPFTVIEKATVLPCSCWNKNIVERTHTLYCFCLSNHAKCKLAWEKRKSESDFTSNIAQMWFQFFFFSFKPSSSLNTIYCLHWHFVSCFISFIIIFSIVTIIYIIKTPKQFTPSVATSSRWLKTQRHSRPSLLQKIVVTEMVRVVTMMITMILG